MQCNSLLLRPATWSDSRSTTGSGTRRICPKCGEPTSKSGSTNSTSSGSAVSCSSMGRTSSRSIPVVATKQQRCGGCDRQYAGRKQYYNRKTWEMYHRIRYSSYFCDKITSSGSAYNCSELERNCSTEREEYYEYDSSATTRTATTEDELSECEELIFELEL